jgi:site-specific DNA-methyltransferase (adenine-specific)
MTNNSKPKTSTVGRSKILKMELKDDLKTWKDDFVSLTHDDSLNQYKNWKTPTAIISDGAYGILGFEGDTSSHLGIAEWYEPHILEWSKQANPQTTLWFWNSEIGWAATHSTLEKHGWRYVNTNVWNKGIAHIAGNVNTAKIRRFPVVSELCVQYVYEPKINDMTLKKWLYSEWKRTKLPLKKANEACGVKDAAVRKYLDQGHLWYFPPPETFERMAHFANEYGDKSGIPYFSIDGKTSLNSAQWLQMRSKFYCPHGYTNVWDRPSLKGKERIKIPNKDSKAAHLNQKPLDLMSLIIESSTDIGDVIWEPFGGLFSASLAAKNLKRLAFGSELDPDYFQLATTRFNNL